MTRAEEMAKKLHGTAACPKCGHELKEGDEVMVSDWNLAILYCKVRGNGRLDNHGYDATETWKDEEEVQCPECEEWSPMEEWGNLSF